MISRSWFTTSLAAISLLVALGCGNTPAASYERERSPELTLSIDDVLNIGFKTIREYDIEGLTGANGAWFGFRRVSGLEPTEYEVRAYSSHGDAIEYGEFFAQDVTGEDGNVITEDAAWKTGTADRWVHRLPLGSANASQDPKYHDYLILGNFVILCEGINEVASQEACDWMASQLKSVS